MARRNKPKTPRDFSEQATARREREREIARLEAQGVTVKADPAKRIISAYRSNVLNLLLERRTIGAGHHDAGKKLAEDWAAWKGLDGKPDGPRERVDAEVGSSRALVTDRMLRAGRAVAAAMASVGPAHARLLEAYMVATVEEDRPMAWRGIVQRVTGETSHSTQAQMVVAALEALRQHFEAPRTQDRVAA